MGRLLISGSEAANTGVEFAHVTRSGEEKLIPGIRISNAKAEQIARLLVDGWSFRATSILTRSCMSTVARVGEHLKTIGVRIPRAGKRKQVDGRKPVSWMGWTWLEKL